MNAKVTVTGVANTRPSGSNFRIGLSAVMPAGAASVVVVIVIIVVDETAPGGTSSFAELSASATVPPADGEIDALAVDAFVAVPAPPPQPTVTNAAIAAMLERRTNRCRRNTRDMTPREERGWTNTVPAPIGGLQGAFTI